MTWMTKLVVLGLAAVGGVVALRCLPVEPRHRLTRTAGDWVNKKMLAHMGWIMASLPEGAPPKLVMSVLPKLQAQNEEILELLRVQNELLRRGQNISELSLDA